MTVDDLFPGSVGLPRWRTCQIPDHGAATKCQNPYSGEGFLNQIPVGSPPPSPPWGLTLIGALCKSRKEMLCLSAARSHALSTSRKLRVTG